MNFRLLFLFVICLFARISYGQCISSFPYREDFEVNNGGWTSGGTANDWNWGIPVKPLINRAGSGRKCWITGSLGTSFYNLGERSWVQSPCFDFSLLDHPYLQFKIYWETEAVYDGAVFQYSIDSGTTWVNVGSNLDRVDCLNQNWFNIPGITNLNTLAIPLNGWSGNSMGTSGSCRGGGGSMGWLTVQHCMTNLAHQSHVIFRFAFGSGTTCNDYDGFAFDMIEIDEAPPVVPRFSFRCTAPNTFAFYDSSLTCPTSFKWYFGDPTSGVADSSSSKNPTHFFSTAGNYSVRLDATNTCSGTYRITQIVSIPSLSFVIDSVSCAGGNDGRVSAVLSGGVSATYRWSTAPVQTSATATNLSAGIYRITVSPLNSCLLTDSIFVSEPLPLTHTLSTAPASCGAADGSAIVLPNGGTGPYNFSWLPEGLSGGSVSALTAGDHILMVTDSKGCRDSSFFFLGSIGGGSLSFSSVRSVTCNGFRDGSVAALITGGNAPYSYSWIPSVSVSNVAGSLGPGQYILTVRDSLGCLNRDTVVITEPTALSISPTVIQPTCGFNNGSINIVTNGGTLPYSYNWLPIRFSGSSLSGLGNNSYNLTLIDSHGCVLADTFVLWSPPALSVSLVVKDDTCNLSSGSIQSMASGGTLPYRYNWSYGTSGGPLLSGLPGGLLYSLTITDQAGCVVNDTASVASIGSISIDLGPDTSLCEGEEIVLYPGAFRYYNWQDGSQKDTFIVRKQGFYWVNVSSAFGCEAGDTILVLEECPDAVIMPSGFSPDGNGINDFFGGIAIGIVSAYELQIFNRWGEQVFQSTSLKDRWDGTFKGREQPIGVYAWQMSYRGDNGNLRLRKGTITLLR